MKVDDKELQNIWLAVTNLHVVSKRDDAPFADRDGKFPTGENFMWGVSSEPPSGRMWAISVDGTGFTITNDEGDEGTWFVAVKSPDHAVELILSGAFFKALFS